MSKNTTTTAEKKAAPKPSTVAKNSLRIDALEKAATESHECKVATLEATPSKYLATGRVTLPALGGLALPSGVGFHDYVETEFQDEVNDEGQLVTPSREAITSILQELAAEQHPNNIGVKLCDISVLPTGW